jgi:hypothetical protein
MSKAASVGGLFQPTLAGGNSISCCEVAGSKSFCSSISSMRMSLTALPNYEYGFSTVCTAMTQAAGVTLFAEIHGALLVVESEPLQRSADIVIAVIIGCGGIVSLLCFQIEIKANSIPALAPRLDWIESGQGF